MKDLSIPIDFLGSIYYLKVVSDFPFDITVRSYEWAKVANLEYKIPVFVVTTMQMELPGKL